MADWPDTRLVAPKVISPYSEDSLGGLNNGIYFLAAPGSGTLVQNQAYYFPFVLERGGTAVKMFALIGGTANGNIDVGIYDEEFNYLISIGATAQGATNTLQEFDITDTFLPPGNYWMALSLSSATGTVFRGFANDEIGLPQVPVYVQGTAHPLPTTVATPVKATDATPVTGIVMGVAFDTLI